MMRMDDRKNLDVESQPPMKIYFDPSWQFVAAFALSMSYLTAAVARACAFEMRTDAGSPPAAVE